MYSIKHQSNSSMRKNSDFLRKNLMQFRDRLQEEDFGRILVRVAALASEICQTERLH